MKKKLFGVLLAAALIVTTSGISMASAANPGVCDGAGTNCTGVCDGTGVNRKSGQKAGNKAGQNAGRQANNKSANKGKGTQQKLKDGSGRNNGGNRNRQKLNDGTCRR